MHDQRKVKIDLGEKAKEERAARITAFCALYDECAALRRADRRDRAVLERLDALLDLNPEAYTFFGYRRDVLLSLWSSTAAAGTTANTTSTPTPPAAGTTTTTNDVDEEETKDRISDDTASPPIDDGEKVKESDLERELQLNTDMITRDFKIYAAFVHRRWIMDQLAPARRVQVLLEERKKCEYLLKKDERNFHAWGYRRWVRNLLVAGGVLVDDDDDEFTEAKINANFSNYSAWHNRARDVQRLVAAALSSTTSTASNPQEAAQDDAGSPGASTDASSSSSPQSLLVARLEKELDLCTRAMYCDPNDQSAWLYGIFLVREAALLISLDEEGGAEGGSDDDEKEESLGRWLERGQEGGRRRRTAAAYLARKFAESSLQLLEDEPTLGFPQWMLLSMSRVANADVQRAVDHVCRKKREGGGAPRWDAASGLRALQTADAARAACHQEIFA